jgi:hypothetical protein
MNDVKHTPGPWKAEYFRGDRGSVHCPDGRCVCVVYDNDAPLIAAAPEMLAMLKELEWQGDMECQSDICPMCGADWAEGRSHVENCRLAALIAKAEGNAP